MISLYTVREAHSGKPKTVYTNILPYIVSKGKNDGIL